MARNCSAGAHWRHAPCDNDTLGCARTSGSQAKLQFVEKLRHNGCMGEFSGAGGGEGVACESPECTDEADAETEATACAPDQTSNARWHSLGGPWGLVTCPWKDTGPMFNNRCARHSPSHSPAAAASLGTSHANCPRSHTGCRYAPWPRLEVALQDTDNLPRSNFSSGKLRRNQASTRQGSLRWVDKLRNQDNAPNCNPLLMGSKPEARAAPDKATNFKYRIPGQKGSVPIRSPKTHFQQPCASERTGMYCSASEPDAWRTKACHRCPMGSSSVPPSLPKAERKAPNQSKRGTQRVAGQEADDFLFATRPQHPVPTPDRLHAGNPSGHPWSSQPS